MLSTRPRSGPLMWAPRSLSPSGTNCGRQVFGGEAGWGPNISFLEGLLEDVRMLVSYAYVGGLSKLLYVNQVGAHL